MAGNSNMFDRIVELSHPSLEMKWRRTSGKADLYIGGECIWSGHPHGTSNWIGQYLNRPVRTIMEDRPNFASWKSTYSYPAPHTKQFLRILLACDRRVGWNTLSQWLFTEADPVVRRIVSKRVYAVDLNNGCQASR